MSSMLPISDHTFSGISCDFLTCEHDENPKKITCLSKLYFAVVDKRLFLFIQASS